MVEETFEPGMTVSLVARRHGVAPNQLFTWRRTRWAVLRRLLGKKTLEAESSAPRKQKNGSNADRRNGLAGRRCQKARRPPQSRN